MSKLSSWERISFLCVICAAAITSPAQTDCSVATPCFTTVVSFDGANGTAPNTVLVQGTDGNLYGTTGSGGTDTFGICIQNGGCGTVFKVTPDRTLSTVYYFCVHTNCTDGYAPGQLMLATNGNIYGITEWGGTGDNANCNGNGQIGCGTIFEITVAGKFTTLHSFSGSEGSAPNGLVQATDGNLYGTASQGGTHSNAGTVFQFNPKTERLTTFYDFCSKPNCSDGATPSGTLVQGTDGNLYGTTWAGGADGVGTVFKIMRGPKLITLHSFDGTDGSNGPASGVVQATDGNFYGTTVNNPSGLGTVFKMTPGGAFKTLNTFDGTDGQYPYAGLVQATDGNLYGTTFFGGNAQLNCPTAVGNLACGTVFQFNAKTVLNTLYTFCPQTPCTDGAGPLAGLVQTTDGNFYGTTSGGGANNVGTAFSLSVGLGPFVATLPTSGRVGTAVTILGNNLTGAISVGFNGTAAIFTVNPTGTAITTTVPNGATTGKVTVTTPSRTLTSKESFRVTPTISSFSPTSGSPGTSVVMTGESFTGATSVTFGGVKGSITSVSYTKVTATVPAGAKTGKISVTTPGGTAISSGTFTVT